MLGPADLAAFERDGFLIQRSAFTAQQMGAVSKVARADPEVADARLESAKQIKLWGDLRDDSVYAAVARQRGIVGPVSQFLGGSGVEHYHHKLIMKDPPKLDTSTGETPLYGAALDSNHQQKGLCSA